MLILYIRVKIFEYTTILLYCCLHLFISYTVALQPSILPAEIAIKHSIKLISHAILYQCSNLCVCRVLHASYWHGSNNY